MARPSVSPRIERFNHLLEVVGFEGAPFAWHISGMPIDIEEFAKLLSKEPSEISG
jgi:hypothetical protein